MHRFKSAIHYFATSLSWETDVFLLKICVKLFKQNILMICFLKHLIYSTRNTSSSDSWWNEVLVWWSKFSIRRRIGDLQCLQFNTQVGWAVKSSVKVEINWIPEMTQYDIYIVLMVKTICVIPCADSSLTTYQQCEMQWRCGHVSSVEMRVHTCLMCLPFQCLLLTLFPRPCRRSRTDAP